MSFRSPLDNLPLFASDIELAEAIVGKKFAAEWVKTRLPTLAGKVGFPQVDAFHGGRPVPLIRRFYEHYLAITDPDRSAHRAHQALENPGAWKPSRNKQSSPKMIAEGNRLLEEHFDRKYSTKRRKRGED